MSTMPYRQAQAAPPLIHVMRHAHGEHELSPLNVGLHDPCLTQEGIEFAQRFAKTSEMISYLRKLPSGSLSICASPLQRCIQSALLALAPALQTHPEVRVILQPLAQESFGENEDRGSSLAEIKAMFPEAPLDYSVLEPEPYWNSKYGIYAPVPDALFARAARLRAWLRNPDGAAERGVTDVVLMAHGNFGHYLVHAVDQNGEQVGPNWNHLDWRTYRFTGSENVDPNDPLLVETKESILRNEDHGKAAG